MSQTVVRPDSLRNRQRRHANLGSDPEYNRLSITARWLWAWMQEARANEKKVNPLNRRCDWTRGYWRGVATATKIILRDVLRTRRALRRAARGEQ